MTFRLSQTYKFSSGLVTLLYRCLDTRQRLFLQRPTLTSSHSMAAGQRLPLLFTFLPLLSVTSALIPAACVHNVTVSPHICCPTPTGFSQPCGYPTRGQCRLVSAYKPPRRLPGHQLTYTYDIRIEWPSRIFNSTCHCVDNFWGPDCATCKLGTASIVFAISDATSCPTRRLNATDICEFLTPVATRTPAT